MIRLTCLHDTIMDNGINYFIKFNPIPINPNYTLYTLYEVQSAIANQFILIFNKVDLIHFEFNFVLFAALFEILNVV